VSHRSTVGPPGRRAFRRVSMLAGAGLLTLVLAGCSSEDLPRLGLPDPATDQGHRILFLWQGSWIAALAVGALVWGLIIWSIIFHRRRSDADVPVQTRYNVPLEVLYTVVPAMMVLVLFFYTARDEAKITSLSEPADHTVSVVGYKWAWEFNYVEEGTYDVGTNGDLPVLYLPQGESVRFTLTSPDVIHSFWIIPFLMKMDVIPGRTNEFQVTPTQLGTFKGKCAELCGVNHSRMLFEVKVVTAEEYAQHQIDLKARGQVGNLVDGRTSNQANGKQGTTSIGGTP
jgi:cytochrome c oxidase subunit II